jgi:hypothetical protein
MHRVNLFADKAKAQDQDDQQAQHTDAAHLFDKESRQKTSARHSLLAMVWGKGQWLALLFHSA